ncbi:MAG: Fic family protein [Planctomycetes bacterium]|nr:Fic family protein [Planctomycetota bacterium]
MPSAWKPVYTITPKVARLLMEIETSRAEVEHTPLPPTVEAELRRQARIRSTHYSTRIEGNRLTLAEAEKVIREAKTDFHGRERDVREVKNYWNALLRVEEWAEAKRPVGEDLIRRLHALVEHGPRAKPTPYRDGQNVIRDSASGAVVYMPPEAKDVPGLMSAMVRWIVEAEKTDLPIPLLAGLAHYQFVTIHPYYDGNGRTARLLATFLLHRGGYGLHGFISVEEHHARDLAAYYRALAVHSHHNYYGGRANADLTPWVEYFVTTLAGTFEAVRKEAKRLAKEGVPVEPEELRHLDRRARIVLGLFAKADRIAAPDVARALGLSERMVRVLLQQWVKDGWLAVADPSRRKRSYELTAIYRQYVGKLSAIPGWKTEWLGTRR